MRNKKGALALSINAIVILIIAITMLGLALGFTRGMFGKISTQIEEKISEEPEPPIPTGADTVTLSKESIITRAGETVILKISLYNPTNEDLPFNPDVTCNGVNLGDVQKNSVTVSAGEKATLSALIPISDTQAAATGLCQVIATAGYTKDFTIKVVQ